MSVATVENELNLKSGDGVGVKVGASTGKVALFGGTPVVQRSAYTQTYSTASRTAAALTVGTDIAAFTDPPSAAEMALLRTFVNALKADLTNVKQVQAAIVDDLQAIAACAP